MLHDQEVDPCMVADVVEHADMRMIQAGNGPRFTLEALPGLGIVRDAGGKNLDGHRAVESRVLCTVHLAHATRTDGSEDLIGPQASSSRKRHKSDRFYSGSGQHGGLGPKRRRLLFETPGQPQIPPTRQLLPPTKRVDEVG